MARPRIASPMPGVACRLSRLSARPHPMRMPAASSYARSISTSTSSHAAVASITTAPDGHVPVLPLADQTVLATIHRFPSLEPLRLQSYPAIYLNLPTRRDILHRAVIYEGDMTRLGTAHKKNRYEVRGSMRKLRPQKGSGKARLGDRKSPTIKGGGLSHGPRHRDFSTDLQSKVYDLAWRTALSYRWRKGELLIVDNAIELESPSPRLLSHIFDAHERERGKGRSLLITSETRPLLQQALEKMDRPNQVLTWEDVDVKNLLELSRLIIERRALSMIFRNHISDLSESRLPSYLRSHEPETTYTSMPGWSQFRELVTASSSERDAVRIETYESVATERWDRAMALRSNKSEQIALQVASLELLAEAKDLRREQLPTIAPLMGRKTQTEQELDQLQANPQYEEHDTAVTRARLELSKAEVSYFERLLQEAGLMAEAAEHRRDLFLLKGEKEKEQAEKMDDAAADARGHEHEITKDLLQSKVYRATDTAAVLIDEGRPDDAAEYQAEAEAWQEKLDAWQLSEESMPTERKRRELKEKLKAERKLAEEFLAKKDRRAAQHQAEAAALQAELEALDVVPQTEAEAQRHQLEMKMLAAQQQIDKLSAQGDVAGALKHQAEVADLQRELDDLDVEAVQESEEGLQQLEAEAHAQEEGKAQEAEKAKEEDPKVEKTEEEAEKTEKEAKKTKKTKKKP